MSNLIVHGGTPLRGRITPSANKNAVLPVLCATLLTREPLRLHGVPDITDVRKLLEFEFNPPFSVLSYQELAPDLNIQPVARISTMR